MLNIILYFLCFIFFCIPSFALDEQKRPRPVDIDNLPTAKRTVHNFQVLVNTFYFKETESNTDDLMAIKTGYSPKKNTLMSIRSPAIEEAVLSVKLQEGQMRPGFSLRRNLFSVFDEDALQDDEIAVTEFATITSDMNQFGSGKWVNVDPWNLKRIIGIDCDHPIWPEFISHLADEVLFDTPELFIACVIGGIKRNENKFSKACYFDRSNQVVCSHYATYALPIFTMIAQHERSNFNAKIHQISADFLDASFKQNGPGHAWNVLIFSGGEADESHWVVDVFNEYFIKLSKNVSLRDLFVHVLDMKEKGKLYREDSIEPESDIWKITKHTMEIFDLDPDLKRSELYKKPKNREIITKKFLLNYRYPKDIFNEIDVENK